jgi:hypothetical protein
MAAVKPIMNSFNAGELSPLMKSRKDFQKYNNGCATLQNMLPLSQGPVMRRPGTYYIAEVKDSNDPARLIPFEFSKSDTYILEFGDEYMRVYRNGGQVLDSVGTEDLGGLNNITAHWLLNDNDVGTAVLDDNGNAHDGNASTSTETLSTAGKADKAFDLDGKYDVEIADDDDFSFTNGLNDSPFSIVCWAYVSQQEKTQILLSKWRDRSAAQEWRFSLDKDKKLQLHLADMSTNLQSDCIAQWNLNDDAADTSVAQSGKVYDITAVNTTAETFTIQPGSDKSASFPNGSEFTVAGSTGNDGQWVVSSTNWSSPNLTITVTGDITDATADGTVAPHAGVATVNTSTLSTTGWINDCFDFDTQYAVEVDDSDDFSFDDSGSPSSDPFSVTAWVYVTDTGTGQIILSKWNTGAAASREWEFRINYDVTLRFDLSDQSAGQNAYRFSDSALSAGWHFVSAVYDNADTSYTPATAADFVTLYVDGQAVSSTATTQAGYLGMENKTAPLLTGAHASGGVNEYHFSDKIDNIGLFNAALSPSNISGLWNSGSGTETFKEVEVSAVSDDAVSPGWHMLACTYSAPGDESTAADGITFYVDGVAVSSTATNDTDYMAMQDSDEEVRIGSQRNAADTANEKFWDDKIDEISVFSDVLAPAEIAGLYDTATYEIQTEYTKDQLNDLQYVQLADTMYITHPDHEPRVLTRTGHTAWTIEDVNYIDGPFLEENTDTDITVKPSAATGTITITASDKIFNSEHVGSIWQIRHPRDDATLSGSFSSAASSSAIDCEGDYKLTSHGDWTGTLDLERSRDGSTWEKVSGGHINSVDDDNIIYSDSEQDSGYKYRVTMTSYSSGTCTYDFVVYDHMHTGVVRISSYVDPNEVTATVITELGSADETYYWSEGYWSDRNGWPQTVEFHEFRLFYGGNEYYPQTVWATKADDYDKMKAGTSDAHALIYQLPGQNPIQWMLSHTYLMIGTLGGAGRLGDIDEPMAPTVQPQYKQQSTDGCAFRQAILAGDAILYLERGAKKIREFVYSFEQDKFVSPDMTVLAEHITGGGITSMALQKRPEIVLWCTRADGKLLSMTYNRNHEVVAWALHSLSGQVESVAVIPGGLEDELWLIVKRKIKGITRRYIEQMQPRNWGGDDRDVFFVDCGLTWDGGDAVDITDVSQSDPAIVTVSLWPTDGNGNELADGDQVKIVSVAGMTELNDNIYTIDDCDVPAKTFSLNNSDNTDDIDSTGYTQYISGGTVQRFENTFSGFEHLEDLGIAVLGDGIALGTWVAPADSFTITDWVNKLCAGLCYTSILETMPVVIQSQEGSTAAGQKRIDSVAINFYKSLGTEYGIRTLSNEYGFQFGLDNVFTETSLFTGWKHLRFTRGYAEDDASIYIQQRDPLPLTIRAIIPAVTVNER